MNQKIFALLLICIACALAIKSTHPRNCVKVFDGIARGIDLSVQQATTTITAHWAESHKGPSNLRYEWAVISDALAKGLKSRCSFDAGFDFPDVMGWRDNGVHTTAMAKDVNLENGKTYFVVVRATTSQGTQIYSKSNGIRVDIAHEEPQKINEAHIRHRRETPSQREKRAAALPGACPIDTANRCRAATASVGEFLTQTYGPPEFSAASQAVRAFREIPEELLVINTSSSSSSSSGATLPVGAVVGIALAVAALCCFLVLLAAGAAAILGSRDSKSDKYSINTNRKENIQEF